jgi:hypothetical protein
MLSRTISLGLALLLAATTASAAPKPAPKKPAPKAPAKRVIQGTKQLSGDQAVPGQAYTLGKASPVNFTLVSAEYSTDRICIGDECFVPNADEKFLLLHFIFHNPQKDDLVARYDTVTFTAVDARNNNRECGNPYGQEENRQVLSMLLKPAQKVAGYTFITVPAQGEVPKLIVRSSDDLVLRYDLRGKVKALAGPSRDPKDKTGVSALPSVPASIGVVYPLGEFDVKIESIAFSSQPIKDVEIDEGARFLIATATVRNGAKQPSLLRYDTFDLKSTDTDGADLDWAPSLLRATSDVEYDGQLEPGKEARVRLYAIVPEGITPKDLTLRISDEGRAYVYDLSGLK